MYSQRPTVSLKKPQPWTDPVTGELYPGGNPNELPQPTVPQPQVYSPTNPPAPQPSAQHNVQNDGMKFCKYCGKKILIDAVVCTHCGRQVELLQHAPQQIVINNTPNVSVSQNVVSGKQRDKWTAFLLCFFLGWLGVHRFYENKVATGILWMFTFGMFGIGWLVDLIIILTKPNPYYL